MHNSLFTTSAGLASDCIADSTLLGSNHIQDTASQDLTVNNLNVLLGKILNL